MAAAPHAAISEVGISGMAVYLPPYRVDLSDWCRWTGNDEAKTRAVIGHAFRMPGPDQNVYTLAANAVLRLLRQHAVDPCRVGYLALGTESSTDNAAGAVIVRGLVDQALAAEGKPVLARDCEVPEYKHACLGGIYALKGGLRYLACDGGDRVAIVVSADIAEYARGSTGEPTQGAGAVAMLLERSPRLLALDLCAAGSASAYRGLDFRKPFVRFAGQMPGPYGRLNDLPVFNGRYSTDCYTEATLRALDALFARRDGTSAAWLRGLGAVFMHRPYHHMPRSAWTAAYLAALVRDAGQGDAEATAELDGLCALAGIERAAFTMELAREGGSLCVDALPPPAYAWLPALRKTYSKDGMHRAELADKLRLGSAAMMEFGNLYTAALPAWLAAGLEDARQRDEALEDKTLLLLGYGSGDAAEAIPGRLVPGWREAVARGDFAAALEGAVDLNQAAYESLHDHGDLPGTGTVRGMVIDHMGRHEEGDFQDYGILYYRCAGPV